MASWVSPTIHATGDIFSVTDNNSLAGDLTFLYQAPYANVFNSVSTTLVNGVSTQVTLAGTVATGYGFSVVSNNLIAPLTGVYAYTGQVFVSSAAAHAIFSEVYHNGTIFSQTSTPLNSDTVGGATSGIMLCSATDTIGLWGIQTSGANLSTNATSGNTYLTAFFVGSQ